MVKALRVTLAAALLCAAGASTSTAQVVRVGPTALAISGLTRGSNVAYDSVNNVYLVVGTYGVLRGVFVDRNGTVLGNPFIIQANPALFSHFPNVTFSPDADGGAGGFLVAWHQSDIQAGASVHARIVSYTKGGPIGNDNQVSVEGSFWERYPGVAYSTVSKEFLVTYPLVSRGIRGVRVGLDGAALAAPFTIALNGQAEEWSSVAYNPTTNQFAVAYEGFTSFGTVYVRGVQAGTGALVGALPVTVFAGGANYINEIRYNADTNQFLVVWYRDAGGAAKNILGRVLNADLSFPGDVTAVSSLWKAYDGLGFDYNRITKTFYMVSHGSGFEDGGVEVKPDGTPVDNGILVTSSPDLKPNYYPKLAAGTADPNWLLVTAHNFAYTATQLLVGTPSGPPPPPPPLPQMALESPTAGPKTVPFTVSGWAVDIGSANGTGADKIDIWAVPPAPGAPIFLASAVPNQPRPDIGAIYGSRFTNSGFSVRITGGLPLGSYTIAAFMRSTVTGTFNAVRTVEIGVTGFTGSDTSRGTDFDGDARSEFTVYNPQNGVWSSLKSSASWGTATNISWGGAGYAPAPGDYDGDGKTDLGVYQESSGNWYVLLSASGYTTSLFKNAGGAGWSPVQSDFDGDGKTDFAVYNRSSGLWFGLKSGSGYTTTVAVNWGGAGYTPAPGDFDGDGKADLAVYETSSGNWYVLLSVANYTTSMSKSVGGAGYIPVQADYDGDGKTDFAVYNTSTGLWYGLKSGSGYTTTVAVYWGGAGFAPVRGDLDGDGKADLAVYETSSGNWYVLLSNSGYQSGLSKNWGGPGYIAIQPFE